jgi:hypothetical protein
MSRQITSVQRLNYSLPTEKVSGSSNAERGKEHCLKFFLGEEYFKTLSISQLYSSLW